MSAEKKGRTALVTGGAGFIGSHLTERLLEGGWNVVVFDNFDPFYDPSVKEANINSFSKTAPNRLVLVRGSICNEGAVRQVFRSHSFDSVFHLAALAGVRPSIERPMAYHDVNVGGTALLLRACVDSGVRKFVFGSSSSVYGGNRKTPFSEDDYVGTPISPYAATKRAAELYCHAFHHLHGLSVAALRFFTVFGPRQRPDLAIHKFTKLMLQGQKIPVFGDGGTQRDYTYVSDIVDGIVLASAWLDKQRKPVFEIFNLGNSSPTKLFELVVALEKSIGVKADVDRLPPQPGDMEVTYADLRKSVKILGYRPRVSFEEGVSRFVEWYRTRIDKGVAPKP